MTLVKYNAIIISSLLLFVYGCDQTSNSKVYKTYYENGAIKDSVLYVGDSAIDGMGYYFYPSGKIQRIYNLKSGKKEGFDSLFREDGSLELLEYYHQGSLDSIFKSFYPSGKVFTTCQLKGGKRYGDFIEYREDGTLANYQFYYPEDRIIYSQEYNEGVDI